MAKSAKQISQFIKKTFSMYGLDYTEFFHDYNEDDIPIPAPIFKNDTVDRKTIDEISTILGISQESILNTDIEASKKWYNKYSFFSHLPKLMGAMKRALYSDDGFAEVLLSKAIFGDKCTSNFPFRYDFECVKARLISELKRINQVVPNTFHEGAEIQNLEISTQQFYSYPQINAMAFSFLEMFERLKYLFFRAKDIYAIYAFELEQDEIYEYNFLVSVFNARDIVGQEKLYYDKVVKLRKVYEKEKYEDFFSYVKIDNIFTNPWLCKEFTQNKELFQLYINIYPEQLSQIRQVARMISKFECTFNWSDEQPLNLNIDDDFLSLDDEWLLNEVEDAEKINNYMKIIYIDKTADELNGDESFIKPLLYLTGVPSLGGVKMPKRELPLNYNSSSEWAKRVCIHINALRGDNNG